MPLGIIPLGIIFRVFTTSGPRGGENVEKEITNIIIHY